MPSCVRGPRPPCPAATGCTRTTGPVRRAESPRTDRTVSFRRSTNPCRPPLPSPPVRGGHRDSALACRAPRDHPRARPGPETWRALAQHTPARSAGSPARRPDDHDVWLIGWDSYQGVDLHDHGDRAEPSTWSKATARDLDPAGGRHVPRAAAPPGRHREGLRAWTRAPGREPLPLPWRPACTCTRRRCDHGLLRRRERTLVPTHSEPALGTRTGRGELR